MYKLFCFTAIVINHQVKQKTTVISFSFLCITCFPFFLVFFLFWFKLRSEYFKSINNPASTFKRVFIYYDCDHNIVHYNQICTISPNWAALLLTICVFFACSLWAPLSSRSSRGHGSSTGPSLCSSTTQKAETTSSSSSSISPSESLFVFKQWPQF